MNEIKDSIYEGERALFMKRDIRVTNCKFQNGESPLKEGKNIFVDKCQFSWKYPLWYCNNVEVLNSMFDNTARSGIWYTNNICIKDSIINAPKLFRRCKGITLINCRLENALETLWMCEDITLINCYIKGDYFGLNCKNIILDNVVIDGNYCFDGAINISAKNSTFNSKDSFWNTNNVKVINSKIIGEYLGWNSKNLEFYNCKMESNQGFCYIDNLVIKDSIIENSPLSFEYSSVNIDVSCQLDCVKNPNSGVIKSKGIKELILDENIKTNKDMTKYEVK